jgi:TDG/mug DNA glycosylase family protein
MGDKFVTTSHTPSAVPDVLAPGLTVVFCGINPGRVSAAAGAHFANPRNDFWRLLRDASFTPRLYEPLEQFALLELGIGVTNAAYRTTKGSGDLRRGDFAGSARRLDRLARDLEPRALAFVGKEAFRGAFGARPDLGPQRRSLDDVGLFVLPSTSPANAAVPYAERLRWFRELRDWLEPVHRDAVRALLLDRHDRVLLAQFLDDSGQTWWATVGGGADAGERPEDTLRRELAEEAGLKEFELGPEIWTREHVFAWQGRIYRQSERYYVVRIDDHEPVPTIDIGAEHVHDVRWWTLEEVDSTDPELLVPRTLAQRVRELLEHGPPREPIDVGR